MPLEGHGLADLRPALRRTVESAAELHVRCDLDVPLTAAEALSAATGRRCERAARAGVRAAVFTARRSQCSGLMVTVSDERSASIWPGWDRRALAFGSASRRDCPTLAARGGHFSAGPVLPPGLPPDTAP